MIVPVNVDWSQQYTTIDPSAFNNNNNGDKFFCQENPVTSNLLTPHSPSHSLPHDSLSFSPRHIISPTSSRSSSISGPSVDMQAIETWSLDQFDTTQMYSLQLQQPTPSPNGGSTLLPEENKDPLIVQTLKADGKPKRPMNAYFIFMKEYRPKLGAMHPEKNTGEISGMLSQMWKDMSTKDRDVYKTKHAKLMAKFNADFPNYQYERAANGTRRHGSRGGKGALKYAASMNFQYSRAPSNSYQHQQQRYEAPITPPEYFAPDYFPSTSYQHYEVPQEYYQRQVSQSFSQPHPQSQQPRRVISQSFSGPVSYQQPYSSPIYSSPHKSSPHVDRRASASYYDPRMYPTQL